MRRGLLTRWGRGVYLVGPLTDDLTEARAARWRCRTGRWASRSRRSSREFGADRGAAAGRDRAAGSPRRRATGVRIHRIELGRRDITRLEGLPCTTPAVTIVHLARTLARAPARARRPGGLREAPDERSASSSRRSTATAAAAARPVSSACSSSASTTCAPGPSARCGTGSTKPPYPARCSTRSSARGRSTRSGREHRLAVEINGYAAHSSPWAHDRDHRKEQYLLAEGLATRRFTALQAIDEPALVIARHRRRARRSEAVALRALRAGRAHAAALGVAEAAAVAEGALPGPRELDGRGRLEAAAADPARLGAGDAAAPTSRSPGRGRTSSWPSGGRSAAVRRNWVIRSRLPRERLEGRARAGVDVGAQRARSARALGRARPPAGPCCGRSGA